MKKHIIVLGFIFSFLTNQQVLAQTLDKAIATQVAETESYLNYESKKNYQPSSVDDKAFQYILTDKKVILQDINKDGIKDAVVSLSYCEETNCHLTTRYFYLAVFLGLGANQYKLISNKQVSLIGDTKVSNGKIIITTHDFKDSDPHCCPSLKRVMTYKIKDGTLTKIK